MALSRTSSGVAAPATAQTSGSSVADGRGGYRFADVVFDTAQWRLWVGGQEVRCERRVLQVLLRLLLHADTVVSKEDLFASVWGGRLTVENALASAISKLRRALGPYGGARVVTVARLGYRISGPVETLRRDRSPHMSRIGEVLPPNPPTSGSDFALAPGSDAQAIFLAEVGSRADSAGVKAAFETEYRQAAELFNRHGGADGFDRLIARLALVAVLARWQRPVQARRLIDDGMHEAGHGARIRLPTVAHLLARARFECHYERGEFAPALCAAYDMVVHAERLDARERAVIGESWLLVAQAHFHLGHHAQARAVVGKIIRQMNTSATFTPPPPPPAGCPGAADPRPGVCSRGQLQGRRSGSG